MHAASVQQACLSVGQVPSAEIARKEKHYWLCTALTCQARENRSSVYKLENKRTVSTRYGSISVRGKRLLVMGMLRSGNKIEAFIYILKARIRVSKKKARKIKVITLILSYLCVQTCFSECQEPSLNNTVRKKTYCPNRYVENLLS